jgi:serine phosphatase RsbU (regulator of sigma subunit)
MHPTVARLSNQSLGDLIVLYSDGVSEARPSGEEFGDRLMEMARGLDSSHAERFGTQFAQAVRLFRGGRAPEDHETIIVLERLSTGDRLR